MGLSSWVPPPRGTVQLPGHDHWDDLSQKPTPGTIQPPGPTPPGKVWSAEHGHWHNDSSAPATADSTEAGND